MFDSITGFLLPVFSSFTHQIKSASKNHSALPSLLILLCGIGAVPMVSTASAVSQKESVDIAVQGIDGRVHEVGRRADVSRQQAKSPNFGTQAIVSGQDVIPAVIVGTGIDNGDFTVERANGIEVGLRGKLRFDGNCNGLNVFNANGDATYSFSAGVATDSGGSQCSGSQTPVWAFEWSVNSDFEGAAGQNLDDYVYELGMDADPGLGTDFLTFDLVNLPTPAGPPYFDHGIGDNSTSAGAGIEASSESEYANLIANNNVAQNSWRYDFFLFGSLAGFDPAADGRYTIYLQVRDPDTSQVLSRTEIDILVGDAPAESDVTPDIIMGSGIENGEFTVDRSGSIEVGLRGKLRFNSSGNPENTYNHDGQGNYSFDVGVGPGQSFPTPEWAFEWSINTDLDGSANKDLDDFVYEIGLDGDPGLGTDFLTFDNITPNPPDVPYFDHAIGDNGTAPGSGTVAGNATQYQNLIAASNVAQNSWRYDFFNGAGTALQNFDPTVPGRYTIYLEVKDPDSGAVLARSEIDILVGDAPDPSDVTPNVIKGSGIDNGQFSIDRTSGMEVGLRGKLRFDNSCNPLNVFNNNEDGTYSFSAGAAQNSGGALCESPETAVWAIDWSVNTNYDESTNRDLDEFVYEIGLDGDPGFGTDFLVFDPITPNPPEAPFFDHAIGDNATGAGAGTVATSSTQYQNLLQDNNVAQNSWRYDFFNVPGTALENFDPAVDGRYTVYLEVQETDGTLVSRREIDILVGDAPSSVVVQSLSETGDEPTPSDNDFTRIDDAVQALANDSEIVLQGTFDWSEFYARQSWEDAGWWSLLPNGVGNVTLTAASPGAAVIQGPGDLAEVPLEMVFGVFGSNPNLEISNLEIRDFDTSIGIFYNTGGVNVYDGLVLTNNLIRMAEDAEDASSDLQNIGVHYSFGDNIVISNNVIEIPGSAGYDGGTSVAMQSNTSGGAYEGLLIEDNVVRVLNAQDASFPERIVGIWENGNSHTSNITVRGNSFENQAAGNDPLANEQQGFRLTSHSSASSTALYQDNSASGAKIGFAWLSFDSFGADYSSQEPVMFDNNDAISGNIGIRIDSNGAGVFVDNDFSGNVIGVENVTVAARESDATCNWWGSTDGPSVNGAGSASAVVGNVLYSPWNSSPTGPCDAFKVTRQSDGAGFNTFSAAITDSGTLDGDTLVSTAATYPENVVVDKELTLTGAGAASTIIDGNIRISADNVTVSDLGVVNGATVLGETSAIYIDGGTSGHQIGNTALTGTGASPTRGIIISSGGVSDVDVLNSTISAWTTGMYINPGADNITISGNSISDTAAGIAGDDYGNVIIDNNDLFDNGEGIGYSGPAGSGPTITNNEFSSNGAHVRSYGSAVLDAASIEANNTFDQVVLNLTQGDLLVTIQDAINSANAGDTLLAPADTYEESITVNVDNLTLQGEQAGVVPSGRTAGGASESIIDAQTGDKAVDILASGFTLDGFSVTTTASVLRGVFESNSVSDTSVSNNFVYGFPSAYGVSLAAGSASAIVANNVLSDAFGGIYLSTGANSASIIGNAVDGLDAGSGDKGSAITFEGDNTNVSVTGNSLTNNASGLYVFSGFGSDFSGTELTDNQFVGNAGGVNNTNSGTISADCNWWGDDTGPSGEGAGAGDSISENVVAEPWNLETDGQCYGGLPETVYVDDDFAGSSQGDSVIFDHPDLAGSVTATFGNDAFADVSAGLSGVTLDGTVYVAAGNYPGGGLTFDRSQDVIGAGSTSTVLGAAVGDYPNGILGDIVLESDNATLAQVQVNGYDSFRINPAIGGVADAVIRDNYLRRSAQHGIVVDGTGWSITENVIEEATQFGLLGGFLDGASDIFVRGNEIADSSLSGAFFTNGAGITLLNNEVTGSADWGLVSTSDTFMGFNQAQSGSDPALEVRTASSTIYCNQVQEAAGGGPSAVRATDAGVFLGFNALFDDTLVENAAASGQLDASQNWWETSPMTTGDVATEPQLDTLEAFYQSCFPTPELELDQSLVEPGDSVGLTVTVAKPASIDSSGFDLGLNGVEFDVMLPNGLSSSIDTDSCDATLSGSTLSVTNGNLPAGTDSCTIELTLATSSVGSYSFESSVFSSLETGAGDLKGSTELFVGAPELEFTQTAGVQAGLPQDAGWEYFTANLVNNGTDIPENIVLWVDVPSIDDAAVVGGATLQFWDPVDSEWKDFGWGGASSWNVDREDFFLGRAPTEIVGFPVTASYDESIPIRHNFPDGAYTSTTTVESLDSADPGVTQGARLYLDQTVTLAEVTLDDLIQVYDGGPKAATVLTQPSGLNVDVTYDGGSVLPVVAGSYTVEATVNDAGAIGQQIEILTIEPADQAITFPAIGDKPADAATFTISATASSGLPVSYIVTGPATISGDQVTLDNASPGDTVTIDANQAGNVNWNAAPPVQRSFDVVEGAADSIEAVSPTSINGQAGEPVAAGDLPTVLVSDSQDNPVAGVTVSFSVASGGGSITGATQTTDASGMAQVGSWTLGSAATQTLEAAAPGLTGSPLTFTANVPLLEITPASNDYGDVGILDAATAGFTVTNTGSSSLELTGVVTSGDSQFAINGSGNCANGDVLAGGQSCPVEVTFDPDSVASFSGSLDVTSDAGDVSAALSGAGVLPDWSDGFDGAFDEAGWQFYTFDGSTLGTPTTAQITDDYLQINDSSAILAGGYIPRSFGESRVTSLVNADGTNTGNGQDNQIDQGVISHFNPDLLEGYAAYVRYELNYQDLVLVKFDQNNLDPALIDERVRMVESSDGDWSMDRMYVVELDVVNQGGGESLLVARAFDADTGELLATVETIDGDDAGEGAPHAPGYAGVTAIANSTGVNGTFDTASGVSSFASADLSANSIDFGQQVAFSASVAQSITVTNRGNDDLSISALNVAGANAGDFSIQNSDCGSSVAAGDSCSFEVVFTPGAAQPREAEVVIESNASTTPDAVLLEGEGTPAQATVTLSDLTQVYDGGPKSATVTTNPAGLNVVVTYDGSATLPVDAGSYAVEATVDEPNYTGNESGTLEIQAANQTIDFPAIPDRTVDDSPFTISASASSGLAVSFDVVSGPANISGDEVTLTGSLGTVVIEATQGGNTNWNAAPPVQQSFDVVEGAADSIEAVSPTSIDGQAGQPIAAGDLPEVLVTDSENNPIEGVTVSFSVASGGGSITGATQTTDASGMAQMGGWTLGSAATQTLEAAAPGLTGSPVTFTANVPLLEITPASNDYDDVGILDDATATFTVTNTGSSSLELTGVDVSGDSQFGISGTGNCAMDDVLNGGEDCTVEITFDPDSVATFSGSLDITSDAGDVSAALSGAGILPDWSDTFDDGAFDEAGWQFYAFDGSPTLYEPDTAQINGDYLQISDPDAIYLGAYIPRSFGESRVTALVNADGTGDSGLDNQIDQGVISHFDPDSLSGYAAYVGYELDDQVLYLVKFDADIAVDGPIIEETVELVAPPEDLGEMYVVELDVVDQGGDALLVARAFDADTGELLATVDHVDTTPYGPGFAGVTAIANGPSGVNGTFDTASAASSFASADLDTNGIDFGQQEAFSASAPQSITVTNRGNVDLSISALNVAGANAGDFSIQNSDCGSSVAAGDSCSFEVVFTPGAAQPREAEVVIESNASTTPDAVLLEGEGTPAQATVTLSDLTQTYDGDPKSATVTTVPAGLNVIVTYDGSATLPVDAGNYLVEGSIDEPNYTGNESGTLEIQAANQTIDFPAILDQTVDDSPFTISATADSGLAVSFSVVSGPASVSGNEVTLDGVPGTVTIEAAQSGDGNWNPAPTLQQSFEVVEGNAAAIEAASATTITGQAGEPVAAGDLPTVLVTDSQDNPVAGVTVAFSVASGGGSISGATQNTDAMGMAQVGGWTLGGSAVQTLDATAPGLTGSPVVFTANADADYEFTVSVDDSRETIEVGERNSYLIVISNEGSSDAIGAQVTAQLPSELDAATADWTCVPGGAASCGGPGTGDLNDAADLPAGASVFYVLEADVIGGSGGSIELEAEVSLGGATASGSDSTNVAISEDALFSDRFEAAQASNVLRFDSAREQASVWLQFASRLTGGLPPRVILRGENAAGDDAFRVRAIRAGQQLLVRLSVRDSNGNWQRAAWQPVTSTERLLAVDYNAATGTLLVTGEQFQASLIGNASTQPIKRLVTDDGITLQKDD